MVQEDVDSNMNCNRKTVGSKAAWLESYATDRHNWHRTADGHIYYRRLGIVESLFDTDGVDAEGRADLTIHLHVALRTRLVPAALRARLLLAWSIMRQKHILLSARLARVVDLMPASSNVDAVDRAFVFEPCKTPEAMLAEARKHTVFVHDHHSQVDDAEFFVHTLNSSRCIDGFQAMSKLFVMPVRGDQMHIMVVAGHEIVDGLTSMRWMSSFIDLLNRSSSQLMSDAQALCMSSPVERLPPAQESLYPAVTGSWARQQWSWLLTRILRHTRRPPSAAFQNPLRRQCGLLKAIPLEHKFSDILDYSRTPPLNTFSIRAVLTATATRRMTRICREAKISVGSGCFALVAIMMMLFEERRNLNLLAHQRLPFVGSFPVNPRPFLEGKPTSGKEDSLMLAFSDGVTLPFLPSHLDLEGRIRLLGKHTHRQLRHYQKRPRSIKEEVQLGYRSPTQLLPILYLNTMEYLERKSQPSRRRGWNIQGAYPATSGSSMATCGVSSMGSRDSIISAGKYDVDRDDDDDGDLVADFRNLETSVRAREGEFLVGVVGDGAHLMFSVSYDGCAIDPELAQEWKVALEDVLEVTSTPMAKL